MGNKFPRQTCLRHMNQFPMKGPRYEVSKRVMPKKKDKGPVQSQLSFNSPITTRNTVIHNHAMWNAYQIKNKSYILLHYPIEKKDCKRLSSVSREVSSEKELKELMDKSFDILSNHYFFKYEALLETSDSEQTELNGSNALGIDDMKPYSCLKKTYKTIEVSSGYLRRTITIDDEDEDEDEGVVYKTLWMAEGEFDKCYTKSLVDDDIYTVKRRVLRRRVEVLLCHKPNINTNNKFVEDLEVWDLSKPDMNYMYTGILEKEKHSLWSPFEISPFYGWEVPEEIYVLMDLCRIMKTAKRSKSKALFVVRGNELSLTGDPEDVNTVIDVGYRKCRTGNDYSIRGPNVMFYYYHHMLYSERDMKMKPESDIRFKPLPGSVIGDGKRNTPEKTKEDSVHDTPDSSSSEGMKGKSEIQNLATCSGVAATKPKGNTPDSSSSKGMKRKLETQSLATCSGVPATKARYDAAVHFFSNQKISAEAASCIKDMIAHCDNLQTEFRAEKNEPDDTSADDTSAKEKWQRNNDSFFPYVDNDGNRFFCNPKEVDKEKEIKLVSGDFLLPAERTKFHELMMKDKEKTHCLFMRIVKSHKKAYPSHPFDDQIKVLSTLFSSVDNCTGHSATEILKLQPYHVLSELLGMLGCKASSTMKISATNRIQQMMNSQITTIMSIERIAYFVLWLINKADTSNSLKLTSKRGTWLPAALEKFADLKVTITSFMTYNSPRFYPYADNQRYIDNKCIEVHNRVEKEGNLKDNYKYFKLETIYKKATVAEFIWIIRWRKPSEGPLDMVFELTNSDRIDWKAMGIETAA